MDSLEKEIQQWRELPPADVKVGSIGRAEGLQPRNPQVTRLADAARAEADAQKHVDRLRVKLEGDPLLQLDPLLVAVIDGRRYVVDGHHRLRAYRLAQRFTVPVREKVTTMQHAALLSRLVNLDGVKLPMTPGQCAESAWQYLATVTGRGRFTLKDVGLSLRSVAGKFGIASQETVRNMVKRMQATREALNAGQFAPAWCDPVTGWPQWRTARGDGGQAWKDVPAEVERQHKVARLAAKIAHLLDQHGSDLYEEAVALLRQQGKEADDPAPESVDGYDLAPAAT